MQCDVSYDVYDINTFEHKMSIPFVNTEILDGFPIYIDYTNENNQKITTVDKVVDIEDNIHSRELLENNVLEIHLNETKEYYSIPSLDKLFETNMECMIVPNSYGNDLFITSEGCSINDVSPNIIVLDLTNTKLSKVNLEIIYYTDELIFLIQNDKTIVVDYDLNILYK